MKAISTENNTTIPSYNFKGKAVQRFWLSLFFTLNALFLFSQVTITGLIIDKHSKEPIPFANFYLQSNPTKGVSGDFDGY